ncbi:MAG: phage integrase [Candidatus Acidoferrum typicum]|nr:phage integrase [Candidatus Acidoferrum typicum]
MARTRHHQAGYVFKKGSNWYVRYREDVLLEDGSFKRIQKCRRLANATGQYRTKRAAKQLVDEIIGPLNDGASKPESTMSLNQFIEVAYLPYVSDQKRPSTYSGYKNIWLRYVQPNGGVALRDVRTFEAEQMLKIIARQGDLSRTTLGHIKHFLSGVFRFARRQGVLHTPNPMHDVEIPKCRPAGETYAYSLEEETQMLAILPEPAATVVAMAAFTGARKGELRGLTWENYDGSEIRVMKSVWRNHVDEPKRPKSKAAIPVIAPLKALLERHRARCGNVRRGFIFSNEQGRPMNLEALAVDVIRPALGKADLPWYGWHAFRRGLATNLHRLGVSDKVIQQILRHANVTTTMNIYVKTVSVDAANAMKTLETMCATTVQPQRFGSSHLM